VTEDQKTELTPEAARGLSWFVARTSSRDTIAAFYLERAGLTVFRPLVHRYFTDRRTQQERYRVLSLFPGYAFVALTDAAEREAAVSAVGVASLLGSWTGDRFAPKEIPSQWVAALVEAGPLVEGKRVAFRKGDAVKAAVGGIAGLIGTIEAIDNSHTAVVSMAMLGAVRRVSVALEHLELAETATDTVQSRSAQRPTSALSAKLSKNSSLKAAVNA
jgi:transcription antitermination factor NusG